MATSDVITQDIADLQSCYFQYMASLKKVLDWGDDNIDPLVAALKHKHANPVAKALGLMMYSPSAAKAIPALLEWLVVQSPMYPDILEALVRGGDKIAPEALSLLLQYASKGDDEAVRNLFDLVCRFSDVVKPSIVSLAKELLDHQNPHIRECAADALTEIGLPAGALAKEKLRNVSVHDTDASVRSSAHEALCRME